MPTLGNALDFAKYEGRNFRGHQLGTAPSSPVTGQLYYNTADNTLYWWDGTQWQSAKGGATSTPPATTSSLGTVQLAGDLAGTATSPQIAAGVITDVEVAAANKDGLKTVPSLRTLGTPGTAQQALQGNTRLDQITAPAAPLDMNVQKIINVATPTGFSDAANKQYVDDTAAGLDAKASVKCATTANITDLSTVSTIDGVSLVVGDRVLVKNQATAGANGIYAMTSASDLSQRAADMNIWAEVPSAFVWVEQGTVNADTGWVCTADQGGTLGTTAINWSQFSGTGQITAGAGLTKTGNTLDVGQGTGIVVAADTVSIDTTTIPRYYSSATHGAGAAITITQATHGCRASRGLVVMTVVEATGAEVIGDVVVAANGDVSITFGASQSANTIRTTIVG